MSRLTDKKEAEATQRQVEREAKSVGGKANIGLLRYVKLAAIEDIEEEFGIDFQAIYTLAKSQIATAKNNIELQEAIIDKQAAECLVQEMEIGVNELKHQLEVCERALENRVRKSCEVDMWQKYGKEFISDELQQAEAEIEKEKEG